MAVVTLLLLSFLAAPELPGIDEKGLAELVGDPGGKALVVNFWATWCAPCREEFPEFVQLYEEKKDAGLKVVTISMDEPEDREKALRFLAEQGAAFPSYIRSFEDFYQFVDAVDSNWSGALPATFVFDPTGARVYSKEGKVTREELERQIAPLLERE